ncbi:MFS general substrate transporter [Russula compacta]|nr:MFS general substrate transporter [Russula compacta]
MSDTIQGELKGGPTSSTKPREESFSKGEDLGERRIWRKLDIHLLPWVGLLYFFCFLDRINIGNAKIAGMSEDLHLVGLRYNTAAAVLFITHSLVDVPSNVVLKLFRPSRWIPTLMVAWGIIMTLMSLVNSYQGLVIARVFLGLAEGGMFPGVSYCISLWYPRQMQVQRIATFPAASCVAGASGGILAYGIQYLEGTAGLHGWQWIFLIEGLATIVIAFVSYFLMHDYPETATFLTEDERHLVIQALRDDRRGQPLHFSMKFVWQALTDWKTYIQIIVFMCITVAVYSVALFMPTIIHDLGFSAAAAQLLSAPPFVCSGILTIIVGIYSDRMNSRGPFVVLGAVVSMVGYIIVYTTSKPGFGYAAAIIAASGVFPSIAVIIVWAGGNAGGDLKRGVVIAMVIGIGNFAGICSSYIYYQPPRFHKGHGTVLGCLGMSIIGSLILMWKYRALNKAKEELCLRNGIDEGMEDEYDELGDESPLFRYVI